MKRTPLRRSPIARGSGPKPKRRKLSAFARIYGSKARVEWIKGLPCIVAHSGDCIGGIENAHTANGGLGRKADAHTIVPLCHNHHAQLHAWGVRTFEAVHGVTLDEDADAVEAMWLAAQAAA